MDVYQAIPCHCGSDLFRPRGHCERGPVWWGEEETFELARERERERERASLCLLGLDTMLESLFSNAGRAGHVFIGAVSAAANES